MTKPSTAVAAAPESLRERNKRDKLRRLTKAARELFAKHGFQPTTIRQIAAHAGIGVGTVFLYVSDKEGLLQLLFRETVLDLEEQAFSSLPESLPLVEQMVHVFSRFYRYYAEDRGLSRLFIKELLFVTTDTKQEHLALTLRFVARIADCIERAQRRGELRSDFVPMMAATNFFAAYFLVVVGFLDPNYGANMDVDQAVMMLRTALTIQIQGLAPAAPGQAQTPDQTPDQTSAPTAAEKPAARRRRASRSDQQS